MFSTYKNIYSFIKRSSLKEVIGIKYGHLVGVVAEDEGEDAGLAGRDTVGDDTTDRI